MDGRAADRQLQRARRQAGDQAAAQRLPSFPTQPDEADNAPAKRAGDGRMRSIACLTDEDFGGGYRPAATKSAPVTPPWPSISPRVWRSRPSAPATGNHMVPARAP